MNDLITWATQHNTIVIQVIFSIVLLLILIYVYRLFFVSSATAGAGDSIELGEVNQKLDQLLEQQKTSGIQVIEKVVPAAEVAASPTASVDPATAGELDQAKAENAKLKAQLNELEKKVFELTPIAGAEESVKQDAGSSAQVADLTKKLEEMQSRLSEYDIIADDIAELGQLRTENAELKKKLESGGAGASSAAASEPAEIEAVVTAAVEEVPVVEEVQVAAEVAPEPLPEIEVAAVVEATPAVEGGVPGFDAETSALLDSLVAETDAAAAAAPVEEKVAEVAEVKEEPPVEEPVVKMDQNIPEDEKSLINEFEKSVQKGS